jgi:hypothetical protein
MVPLLAISQIGSLNFRGRAMFAPSFRIASTNAPMAMELLAGC